MRHRLGSIQILVLAISLVPSAARGQDIEAMMKWQMAEAVHYDVVAVYSGPAVIVKTDTPTRASYNGQVTDRFEIGFDWNPAGMSLVGKPTFKNFPSALPAGTPPYVVAGSQCAGPKLSSPYDHVEIVGANAGVLGSNALELSAKRTFGAGAVSHWNENGCGNWVQATASSETVSLAIQVPLGLMLVMPRETLPANMTVKGPDTVVLDDSKKDGWTYTYTLKVVK
jgi:hypothetical protein